MPRNSRMIRQREHRIEHAVRAAKIKLEEERRREVRARRLRALTPAAPNPFVLFFPGFATFEKAALGGMYVAAELTLLLFAGWLKVASRT